MGSTSSPTSCLFRGTAASPAAPSIICNTTGCITSNTVNTSTTEVTPTRYTTYNTLTVGVTTLTITRCITYTTLSTGITCSTHTRGNTGREITHCITDSTPDISIMDQTITPFITYSTLTITTTSLDTAPSTGAFQQSNERSGYVQPPITVPMKRGII